MSESRESTKQLRRILGTGDLLGAAFGYIIGPGIMTLLGDAISLTGRSVPLAFLIAAVIVVLQCLPVVVISGVVRLRGGNYTAMIMLCGKKIAGAYAIISIFSNMSLAVYALSFGNYFCSLTGCSTAWERPAALGILTLLYVMNLMGIDKFAKAQKMIAAVMIASLMMFVLAGTGKVDMQAYRNPETFLTGGVWGLFLASSKMTFVIGGGAGIINLSAESKNPTRDIPLAVIVSTVCVAAMYAWVAFVASGVLPLEQVAGQNLTVAAAAVLPLLLYLIFVLCGAGLAMISPMNTQFATAPKPVMQMCDDGWLPQRLAALSRWKTPAVILTLLYGIGVLFIFTGLSISTLVSMCIVAVTGFSTLMNACIVRLPEICPEEWEHSKYRMSRPALALVAVLGTLASILNICLNAAGLSPGALAATVGLFVISLCFGIIRGGRIHVKVSYE